jgi:hypothetical protein
MKENEVYESWKQEKRQIDVSQNFTDRVMNRVYQCEQNKEKSLFTMARLIELISLHPLAKTGLVVVGAAMGIVRIIIMIQTILNNGVVNG